MHCRTTVVHFFMPIAPVVGFRHISPAEKGVQSQPIGGARRV